MHIHNQPKTRAYEITSRTQDYINTFTKTHIYGANLKKYVVIHPTSLLSVYPLSTNDSWSRPTFWISNFLPFCHYVLFDHQHHLTHLPAQWHRWNSDVSLRRCWGLLKPRGRHPPPPWFRKSSNARAVELFLPWRFMDGWPDCLEYHIMPYPYG